MPIDNEEPNSVEAVVRAGIDAALLDLRTVHPCKITVVRANGTVDVDLMIHSVLIDDTTEPLPSITQLPVLFPGNSQYSVTFPVAVGDEGLALFAERDISLFLSDGKTGPPNALRRHDLSDGLFLPTPISQPAALPVVPDALLLANGTTSIEITGGLIKMNGNVEVNGDSLIKGKSDATGEVTGNSATAAVKLTKHGHCYLPGPGTAVVTTGPNIVDAPASGAC